MKEITVNGIVVRIHEVTGFLVSEDGQVFGISRYTGSVRRIPSSIDAATGYDKVTRYNPDTHRNRDRTQSTSLSQRCGFQIQRVSGT